MSTEVEATAGEHPQAAPAAYPFTGGEGLELSYSYMKLIEDGAPIRVQLPFGEPAWLVTRYEDARFVLTDRRFSRNEATRRDEPRMTPRPVPESILTMDAPDHTRLRTLVSKAFTPRRIEGKRAWIGELAAGLVEDMKAAGPTAELVGSYALAIPVTVICELLGVPAEDRAQLRAWCDAALSTNELTDEECVQSFMDLQKYFEDLIAQRRETPRDDLTSALIEARDAHDRLDEQELIGLCIATLIGGFETTASEISNFVHVLQQRRELWTRLCENPDSIQVAVEELLRFVPFAANGISPRYALEDLTVGETLVRAGEPVVVDTSIVNRDESVFENGHEVVLDRADNRHMVFGHGAHHCLGAHLARVELQEALKALVVGMPGLRLNGEITWKSDMIIRAPKTLPVTW
ncbi:cytochrome P450 [Streptomyces sp. NPDC059524]|uniref:cytochrome P450 n=1 Tax=Streptomyces sp. NPDC059524 TaxID=3346856 RepID=UPI003678DB14